MAKVKKKAAAKAKPKARPKAVELIRFMAELAETRQGKSYGGLDNTYSLKLKTNDPRVLDLGKLPALTLFEVRIATSKGDSVSKEVELYE